MVSSNITEQSPAIGSPAKTDVRAMSIVTTLFFMWGFLTCLNDILVPHLKNIFDLNYGQVMLIQFSFFSAYFVFSMPSAKLIEFAGYQKSMVVGLGTMGLGAFLFVPAAAEPSFPLFLTALIVLAAGMTVLQVAANPYVAVLGPPRTASSRLNLTQAFNSLGTTIAPFLGSLLILSAAPKSVEQLRELSAADLHVYRLHEAASVKMPYLALGAALVVLAIVIALSHLPRLAVEDRAPGQASGSIWDHPQLVLGAIAIFLYVGAEVSIGSFLVNYLSQPQIGNLPEQTAARFVSLYWGGAMIGRFIGAYVLRKVNTGKLLGMSAIAASVLVGATIVSVGSLAMWTVLLVGFFNSIMFPSIFTLAIRNLGGLTGKGSGILVMAIVGGAVIPEMQGLIADRIGIHHAFLLPLVCYLYIAYYGAKGSRQPQRASVTPVALEA